jgi:hypothetical protein
MTGLEPKVRLTIVAAMVAVILCLPAASWAENSVDVQVEGVPPLPQVVQVELSDIFHDTLLSVLFAAESGQQLRQGDPVQVADAIRTGINIVIEPKGYSVASLVLDLASTPTSARFLVHPVGWTDKDPHAVTGVEVELSDEGLGQYWATRLGSRLSQNAGVIEEAYRKTLVGLPSQAADRQWALGIVLPHLSDSDPAAQVFPGFEIEHTVVLAPTTIVTLKLKPTGQVIELVRPRMYSRTLYNLILDRLRERLLADSDFLEGMPKAEVEANVKDIAAQLKSSVEADPLARRLNAHVSVEVSVLKDEPVALVTSVVESSTYDMGLEAFIDFGNENSDSTEIQGRFGLIVMKGVEIFANLNYFTNDNTLNTDFALGLLPGKDTFAAVGYNVDRKEPKYFFEHSFTQGLKLRGEVFKDDKLDQFGLSYQFQQYLSAGLFTNGNNEYWVRAILRL